MAACTAARPPEENGKTPLAHVDAPPQRRIVDGDAPPRGAGAPRLISAGPSMRKTEIRMSGGSDAQSLAARAAETDERGFLRWGEEAIGCIPGDLGELKK